MYRFSNHFTIRSFLLLSLTCGLDLSGQITTPIYTVTNPNDSGIGSLRAMISEAPEGALIQFDATLDEEYLSVESPLVIDQSIVIDGSSLPNGITFLSGNRSLDTPIFKISSNNDSELEVTLRHLNFYATESSNSGSAILITSGEVEIDTCTFTMCRSKDGGAVAIINHTKRTSIIDSTFSNNSGIQRGGAIFADAGSLFIDRSVFSENRGSDGAAIWSGTDLPSNQTSITNTTFYKNIASNRGGSLYIESGHVFLTHVTHSENEAYIGEEIFINASSKTEILNSIIGQPARETEAVIAGEGELTSIHSLIGEQTALFPLSNYGGTTRSMPPLPFSIAIDGGAPTELTFDQRGGVRTTGTFPDIGAVELAELRVTTLADEDDGDADPGHGTGRSLREAITHGSSIEAIRFDPGLSGMTIYLTQAKPIELERSILVSAQDLPLPITLSGDSNLNGSKDTEDTSIFRISTNNVSDDRFGNHALRNLIFEGGYNSIRGGGAINTYNSTLIISDSIFRNNSSTANGGAISASGFANNLSLSQSIFLNNESKNGGAISSSTGGLGTVNCQFIGNRASIGGGAIFQYWGFTTIDSSDFINNVSDENGGAVHLTRGEQARIRNSNFRENRSHLGPGGAGHLLTRYLDVKDSHFQNNESATEGGAIQTNAGGHIETSEFIQNTSKTAGGGIHISGNSEITLIDSEFFQNRSGGDGGGIWNSSTLNIESSTISENQSDATGGGIFSAGTLALSNSTISHNIGVENGGGIFSKEEGALEIQYGTIVFNKSDSQDALAAGLAGAGDWIVENSIIAKNSSQGFPSDIPATYSLDASHNFLSEDPLLLPLANYGGPTPTMPPHPDSPVIDAISIAEPALDQRGILRSPENPADFGAVELDLPTDYQVIGGADLDKDGIPLLLELGFGFDPLEFDREKGWSVSIDHAHDQNVVGFPTTPEMSDLFDWIVFRSDSLHNGSFKEVFRYQGSLDESATTWIQFLDDIQPTLEPQFYRIGIELTLPQ